MLKKIMLLIAASTFCMGIPSAYAMHSAPAPSLNSIAHGISKDSHMDLIINAPHSVDVNHGKFVGSVIDTPCPVDANDSRLVDRSRSSGQRITA